MKYVDPDGKWTISFGLGWGPAFKVDIGVNEGDFELQWIEGAGKGVVAAIDFSDEKQVDENRLGLAVEATAEVDIGTVSVGVSSDVSLEYSLDKKSTNVVTEGEISLSASNLESANIEFSFENGMEIVNNEPSQEFGVQTMIIAGFSGQSSVELDK